MSEPSWFSVGNVRVGRGYGLFLIGGPCVIEAPTHCRFPAQQLKAISSQIKIPFIFKASFDKANRTSRSSYRGPGLQEGLSVLKSIRQELEIAVLIDVHEV